EAELPERGEILILKRHRPSDDFVRFVARLAVSTNIVAARHALEVVVTWKRAGTNLKAILGNGEKVGGWPSFLESVGYLADCYRYELERLDGQPRSRFEPYAQYVAELRDELIGARKRPAR